ncbi:CtsR family transcriptional regulator [Alkalicoccus urumqiensis]|uniref:Transcriptional regulator CtsR n=1 Tax=Alkalicoccus urumqiensis TaxID=1548213 RepID=A0A2P6MEG5_ALKUR|nr:CtsR family transcriptional regulator [Alkalicoccus urumqiensis]PRO64640.1 CtsR family transcriptional regulator [Alkalicoccus urumqiensis]
MRNISDVIEQYLKQVIEKNEQALIEVKRSELANRFDCVPSQINYVIRTRFTEEKGYVVESKRGGGGYIRIIKIEFDHRGDLYDQLIEMIGVSLPQQAAENIILRLLEEEAVTDREAKLMKSVIDREVLTIPLPARDQFRARLMTAMIRTLKYKMSNE